VKVEQFNRYARHISLGEIGTKGQQKLLQSKVLVVGLGGLGSPLVQYLAAAGVGTLGLCDFDVVEQSNLQRQVIYTDADCGKSKTELASRVAQSINPDVATHTHSKLEPTNGAKIIASYDVIADASDNFATRYLVNALAVEAAKPLVVAAVSKFEGQLGTFTPHKKNHPCYKCVFPEAPQNAPNCSGEGVLGSLVGVMGSMQATEVIKLLLGLPCINDGLVLVDCLEGRFTRLKAPKLPQCDVCGSPSNLTQSL